jgi:FMN reductase
MAQHAHDLYCKDTKVIDLQDMKIPFCDGNECYNEPIVKELKDIISSAKSIIIAGPIYNYDLNSATKNLLELTGKAWSDKLVGFICAAGGKGSYMSPMSFMNSLMLDFRCIIIPRFVYADGDSFDENNNPDSQLKERIEELVDVSISLSKKIVQ